MFSWLKNKLNPIIPDDIHKGIMTSNFCTIKNGSKISIPQGIICYINYKDKNYLELNSGEYTLNETTLPELCTKQRGKEKKLKKIKIDFYFINTKQFDISFTYKDKVEIQNRLAKLIFTIKYNCNVVDGKKLFNSILYLLPDPNSVSSATLINDYLKEILMNYFFKKNLEDIRLSNGTKEDIKNRISKALAKIGLQLNSFEISAEERVKRKKSVNTEISHTGFFDSFNNSLNQSRQAKNNKNLKVSEIVVEKSIENVDQANQKEYTNSNLANTTNNTLQVNSGDENSNLSVCPRCQNKLIKGSKYCHRCGYEIN